MDQTNALDDSNKWPKQSDGPGLPSNLTATRADILMESLFCMCGARAEPEPGEG
jgi:hypothetical protein